MITVTVTEDTNTLKRAAISTGEDFMNYQLELSKAEANLLLNYL